MQLTEPPHLPSVEEMGISSESLHLAANQYFLEWILPSTIGGTFPTKVPAATYIGRNVPYALPHSPNFLSVISISSISMAKALTSPAGYRKLFKLVSQIISP